MVDYSKKKEKNKRKILFYVLPLIVIIIGGSLLFIFISSQPSSDLSSLFGEDYDQMLIDIGDPVSNPIIPTIEQVNSWLQSDNTDDILYVEDIWMCGDYSTMLLVNAKERSWRMYIVVMFFSFEDDEGYNLAGLYDDSKGHAFNLIYCQDGSDAGTELDIWYVEPQSDVMWNVDYGHYSANNYYFTNVEGTVWNNNIYWINYYNYIG